MSISNLRHLLGSDSVAAIGAVVAVHSGEAQHYEICEDGGIQISVVALTTAAPHTVLLSCFGVYGIPPVGTEGVIIFGDGDVESVGYFIPVVMPNNIADQMLPGVTLVIGDKVEVRTAEGTAVKLAKHEELVELTNRFNELVGKYDLHTHGGPTPGLTFQIGEEAPIPTGTAVLMGE